MFHWAFIAAGTVIAAVFVALAIWDSAYLGWDYGNPETAVVGVGFHAFEWLFMRTAPLALIGAAVGAVLTRKKA